MIDKPHIVFGSFLRRIASGLSPIVHAVDPFVSEPERSLVNMVFVLAFYLGTNRPRAGHWLACGTIDRPEHRLAARANQVLGKKLALDHDGHTLVVFLESHLGGASVVGCDELRSK